MPLFHKLREHAQTKPDRVAVQIGDREISYSALLDRAARLDAWVCSLPRNERSLPELKNIPVFALHMGNAPQVPDFLVAALAGKCCVALLDPLWPEATLLASVDRLRPDVIFTAEDPSIFSDPPCPVIRVQSVADLDALFEKTTTREAHAPAPDTPFMVGFTSGTTSIPKGFARDRKSWIASLDRGAIHFGVTEKTTTLSPGPLVHGLSLYAFAETLHAGSTFHTVEKFHAAGVTEIISQQNVQRLVCVPTMLDGVLGCGAHITGLQQITTAGAKLDDRLLARTAEFAPMAMVTEYYGASELGFVSSITHTPGEISVPRGVGTAFPGVDIRISDAHGDAGQTIWVKSDLTIQDYLWRNDASGLQTEGDWATVGDIGELDPEGNLHLLSRSGGMITSGGNNIYPEEVKACILKHPGVAKTEVISVADAYLGARLLAVVELSDNDLTQAALIAHCQENLQKYKIPKEFYRAQEWPMTSSGKVSTMQLKNWVQEKDTRLVSF